MIVILLGPPGVGKGTQAVGLAEDLGWKHLSTGDLLRKHRRDATGLGLEAQVFMDRGELVPDDIILGMMREELSAGVDGKSVILDGFPRTVAQAEGLDRMLSELSLEIDRVVVLEADRDELIKRLEGRRSCPECGAVFNVHFNPPESEGECDRCGAKLVHREDDRPETVRNRLEVYADRTAPLVDFYANGHAAPVTKVDGTQEVEAVGASIREALGVGEYGS